MDVGEWLRGLGLGQYEEAFRSAAIDGDLLPDLTDADLRGIGLPLGHRKRLLKAIAGLDATPGAAVAQSEASAWDRAERRHIAVLFCDLVGSTSISARLDAEEWRDLLNAYLDAAARSVTAMGGHVAKKLGDGLMALFGYPSAQENDSERAAQAALSIHRAIGELNATNLREGRPELVARIGLASGLVVVDGSGEIFGDAPNVAARVQALAEPGTVLTTSGIYEQIAGQFVAEDRGLHELKGVSAPVTLYRLVRQSSAMRRRAKRALTPLVGRKEEMAIFARRWAKARRDEGQFLLVNGEPGLGKTRLIDEFRLGLTETPHTWVEWNCSQLLQNTALHPVAEWGRQRFNFEDPAERRLANLEETLRRLDLDPDQYLPLLAPALDIPLAPERRPRELSPEEYRRRQLGAIVAWVASSAREQPVVLICEDLHWADPTTLELVRRFAEQAEQAALLVIATARPEFQPRWDMRANHEVLELAPLGGEEVKRMVDEIAARHILSRGMVDGVAARAGGVPLFVEEVTRLLLENDKIGVAAIPPTLQQSLGARLDRLGSAREVAQIAAVLGRDFNLALLREVAQMADSPLANALDRLISSDLLQVEGEPPDPTYRFKHALIRDAAYESLLKSRRQTLHRLVAKALIERFPYRAEAEPEAVAHHFTAAGAHPEAAAYWQRAGFQALQRFANQEAIAHLRKALEELSRAPDAPERAAQEMELQVMLAVPLTLTRGWAAPDVEAAYRRAYDLSGQVGETPQLFPALVGLNTYYIVTAQLHTAYKMAERNLQVAESADDAELILEAEHDLTSTTFYLGRFEELLRHAARVREVYDPNKHHRHVLMYGKEPMVVALVHEAMTLWCVGRPDFALAGSLASIAHAEAWVHPFSYAWAQCAHGAILQMRGEVAKMRETALRVIALSSEQGFPNWLAQGLTYLGWTMVVEGDIETGIEKMREGIGIWRMTGARLISCYLMYLLADALRRGGRFEEAQQTLQEDLELIHDTGDEWWLAEIERLQGQVLLDHTGDCDAAAAAFERALAVARRKSNRESGASRRDKPGPRARERRSPG